MRDVCRGGHRTVATTAVGLERHAKLPTTNNNNNSSRTRNNNTTGFPSTGHGKPAARESSIDDDEEDGDDWDFGIRNLVIDLDADLDVRSRSCGPLENCGSAVDTVPSVEGREEKGPGGNRMSGVEHHSIVDKGLKMKIKRKNVGGKSSDSKQDTNKDHKSQQQQQQQQQNSASATWNSGNGSIGSSSNAGSSTPDKQSERLKHASQANSGATQGDAKAAKGRVLHKRERVKDKNSRGGAEHSQSSAANVNGTCESNVSGCSVSGNNGTSQGGSTACSEVTDCDVAKTEHDAAAVSDPYEFNAKVEDRIGLPVKKVKVEKGDMSEKAAHGGTSANVPETHSVAVGTSSVAVATDPDCLGPCEPGTHVMLEGIVWNETENGVLVVNVTWRGKTYMGTLMDSTKHTWAPPGRRLICESPISDLESRTPKGRGKRGRGIAANQPVAEVGDRKLRKTRRNNMGGNTTPSSPDITNSSANGGATGKRKGRPSDLELSSTESGPKSSKRVRCSMRTTANSVRDPSPELIECPEPNCNKKYRHLNGLKYHQTHAHQEANSPPSAVTPDEPMETDSKPASADRPESVDKEEKVATTKGRGKSPRKVVIPSGSAKDHTNSVSASWFDKDERKVALVSAEESRDAGSGFKESVPSIMAGNKSVHAGRPSASSSRGPGTCIGPMTLGTQVAVTANNHLVSTSGAVVVSSNSASQVHPTSATTVITTVPVVTATIASTTDAQTVKDAGDRLKRCKVERTDKVTVATTVVATKPKSVIATRPLLPAPPVAGIHTTMSAVSGHAPVSHASFTVTSQLKPIQPKPTIMGETTTVNPALTSLKELKEKKSKKKRNKEKSRDAPSDVKSDAVRPAEPLLSVIKPVPSPPRKLVGMITADRTSGGDVRQAIATDVQKQAPVVELNDKVDLTNSVSKGSEACVRPANVQPPSSLSISSPLEVTTDMRERGSNVQSPAYSDISDANDSAPTLENEVEAKSGSAGDDRLCKVSCDQSLDQCVQSTYGICQPFYGQPPYLVPAVPQSQDPMHAGNGSRQSTPKPSLVDKDGTRNKAGSPRNIDPSGEERIDSSGHRGDGCRGDPKLTSEQQREKMMQHTQLFSQYHPYMYSGSGGATGYANYHIPGMTHSPQYKGDQRQRRQEASLRQSPHLRTEPSSTPVKPEQKLGSSDSDTGSRAPVRSPAPKTSFATSALSISSAVLSSHAAPPVSSSPRSQAEKPKNRVPEPKRTVVPPVQADSLKKKQNENHQIMKENIELKNQMPSNRGTTVRGYDASSSAGSSSYDAQFLMEVQRQDVQRFYMFQQQRMLEQQRYNDHQQAVDAHQDSSAEKCTAKDLSKPKVSPPLRDSSGERSRPQGESSHSKEASRHQNDARTHEDKSASPLNMAKGKDRTVSGGILLSGGGLPPAAAQFYGHPFQYAGQVPFDPARSLYSGMGPYIGYANAPGYVHPAAMRYHVTPMEAAEKEAMLLSPGAAGISAEGKALDLLQQHASHYYNAVPGPHKIHELKDVAKPSSGKSTPPLSSAKEGERPDSANSASSPKELNGSPLLQRHLHTHHHTHVVGPGYPMYGSFGCSSESRSVTAADSSAT